MNDTYTNWRRRLEGKQVPTFEMEFDHGFYRAPIKEGRARIGWRPVAFFADELSEGTVCLFGDNVINLPDQMSGIWISCVAHPITEEQYRKAADEGVWFDADPTVDASRAPAGPPGGDVTQALEAQIMEAKNGVPAYAKIEDDETASKAQDLRSHLTTLAGKLDKEREAMVRPHLDAQREINGSLNPIIADAKTAATTLRKSLETWEMLKREAAKSSDKPNAPPPYAQIRGATGRAASVQDAFDAIITDIVAYFQTVKDKPEVIELMNKLAQKDINAGLRPAGVEAKPTVRIR